MERRKTLDMSFTFKEIQVERRRLLTLIGGICLILIMVALPFMTACAEEKPTGEAETLQLGYLVSLTGWFAPLDILQFEECDTLCQIINEQGGVTVGGQQYYLELVAEDCKSSLEGVTAACNRLVLDKGLKLIIGPVAFFSSAAAPVCEANQALHVLGYSCRTPGELDTTTPYGFLSHNGAIGNAMALCEYLKEEHPEIKSIVCTSIDDGAIPYLEPVINEYFEDNGIDVVGSWIPFATDCVDFSPIAARIKAVDADAIYLERGSVEHIAPCFKAVRELGDKRFFFTSSTCACQDIITIAGEDLAYNYAANQPISGAPGNPPLLEELITRLTNKYGTTRSMWFQTTNAVYELVQVIQAAQSLDPTVLKDYWEKLETIETPFGTGRLGGLETYGIRHAVSHPLPVNVLDENGDIHFGGWYEVYVP
jgi:branched-chain amino acid transport system substrate-binding protein